MAQPSDPVARINALTTNARNTWFVLLGVLVFVAITLMGVQHIDFYGVDRQTALPLVNVSVPTWLFFYAAPLLITAVYGYFHLYLIRLWDALGEADADIDSTPLGDVITPWLVTDAALHLRARLREDTCTPPRVIEGPAALLNFLLAWVFGLGILFWTWLKSLPARDFGMTLLAGLCLLACAFVAYVSFRAMWLRMQSYDTRTALGVKKEGLLIAALIYAIPTCIAVSLARTSGTVQTLARLDLTGAELVAKPVGWLPYDVARKDFLAEWCRREQPACAPPDPPEPGLIARLSGTRTQSTPPPRTSPPAAFEAEWGIRRTAVLSTLVKPRWSATGQDPPDFRDARLNESFLSGADLAWAQMQRANLFGAQIEGANLYGAQMQGAELSQALLIEADLSRAQMQRAFLNQTQMQGANLTGAELAQASLIGARMQGANLRWVQMNGARLREASMDETDLSHAQMDWTDLIGAKIEKTNFTAAQMTGAVLARAHLDTVDLTGAQLQGTVFDYSLVTGRADSPTKLLGTNLRSSRNIGGALRFVDLSEAIFDPSTDWRNVFFDGSVIVPTAMRDQIGQPCLWEWVAQNPKSLSDAQFFGRWRGWLTLNPDWIAEGWKAQQSVPDIWRDVEPIAPPNGCVWH